MPIASTDIKFKLSIKTGSAGNSLAQSDVNASLGKYISTTEVSETVHDLFDQITGDENAANDVEYRCIFVHNAHGSLALQNPVMWISSETAGGADLAIAVDDTAQSVIGSGTAQADETVDESTAPSGESFSSPTSKATGISLGSTLDAGKCRAIWIRRTATNSAAINNDGGTIRVEGDTAA